MITRNFNLYLNAGHSIPLVINVNQAEEGEQWVFSLFQEDGTPYIPTDGSIVGIKSDGYLINNSGTVVDGKVVITETKQMTAAAGKAVFELRIDGLTHGTANFIVMVQEDPTDGGIVSDSDLSLIEEALGAVSPLPTGGTVGQVLTKTANGSAWSDAGTPTQAQVAEAVSDWADENITVTTGVVIDQSLTVQGAAADAKKTGDEINDLKSEISGISAIPIEVKRAMDSLFTHMLTNDYDGSAELYTIHAWATANPVVSIAVVYDAEGVVIYDTDDLDDLKQNLTVTATFADSSTAEVDGYTLSGSMEEGTQTFTVTYDGKTATFTADIAYDSTAKVATSGYYRYHISNADSTSPASYGLTASTNAGTTILYDLGSHTNLKVAGIIPTDAFSNKTFYKTGGQLASVIVYSSTDSFVSYVNALGTSAFNRWIQNSGGTMTEYASAYENTAEFSKIEFPVDMRYLDDAYMYDIDTGIVIFAGRNTPYFGMHNISEASE